MRRARPATFVRRPDVSGRGPVLAVRFRRPEAGASAAIPAPASGSSPTLHNAFLVHDFRRGFSGKES